MTFRECCGTTLTEEIYAAWERHQIIDILPAQEKAIKAGLFNSRSLLIVAPTSSGKTFVGEMLCIERAYKGLKSIYLVPFKTIAEERFVEFNERYKDTSRSKWLPFNRQFAGCRLLKANRAPSHRLAFQDGAAEKKS